MGTRIHGIDVVLYEKTQTGTDDFGAPVYTETPVTVSNVLVSPVGSDGLPEALGLADKRAAYTLGIPKGDAHTWEDRKVSFFGSIWHTVGFAVQGEDDLVPLSWNKKISVERYE